MTFLFTDVESSTKLLHTQPRVYAKAIARHHEILATAVEQHGGVVFETVGDAVYAAFAKAADALAAAVDGQRGLVAERWGELGALRVRMGLHTGEVEVRGDHYFGAVLYRCARIMSAAHGGQVVLSLATAELVADADANVSLRDLGTHRLKDLQRPEHLLQLVHADLPAEFPPLRSLDARPNNLPVLRTATVGRERELKELAALLGRDDVQLVTLTGAGGIGKTRLALAAAADSVERFAHGVFVVSLAAVREPELVASAIAAAIGVRETPGRDVRATLRDYARDKQLLLILDNFEHVLPAASAIAELLSSAPATRMLVTSQVPLRLYGEQEYEVAPLDVPTAATDADIAQSAAVRLFLDRAREIRPDFDPTGANARTIAKICGRLDGLPLAIELAAARIRSLSPDAMLERLEQRLPLLTGGARDLPERQQTLLKAMEWSFGLLEPAEQDFFARFSVFAGGCTLANAEAVLPENAGERSSLLDHLESLLAKSLIRRDGGGRFSMLATIREFARDRLDAGVQARALDARHAGHFLELAETADAHLHTGDELVWLERLDAEAGNLRAALAWSFGPHGDLALATALAAALGWYWFLRASHTEATAWLDRVSPEVGPRAAFATAMNAFFKGEHGETGPAGVLARQATAAARRFHDDRALIMGLVQLAFWGMSEDTVDDRTAMDEAVAAAERIGEDWWVALATSIRGEIARMHGDHDAALRWYDRSRAAAIRTGERFVLTLSGVNPAHILLARGDTETARRYFRGSLTLFRELGNRWGMAYCLIGLGGVANAVGKTQDALRLLGAADAWFASMGIRIQPADRVEYERYLAEARSRSGASFDEAWTEAHTLSLDDAAAIDV